MIDQPTFNSFYQAVHERDPFPWQSRLAQLVIGGEWPEEIGVPTGLGKTASIDIAVWALAAQADRAAGQRTAPTRIWYVVNRRLLVDAASDLAERLSEMLDAATDGPVHAVAERLRFIEGGITGRALAVSRLRGGGAMGARPVHPAQPAIICSTVPMYASRLLFRGYGTSNRLWPIDAAHAGTDSLVLLDEAHLSIPLQRLLRVIPDCDTSRTGVLRSPGTFIDHGQREPLLPDERAYPTLVSLTATGQNESQRFDLDADDFENPVVKQRLSARKPTAVRAVVANELVATIATEISDLASSHSRTSILCFVNKPSTARQVAARLLKVDADVLVLTGQMREADATRIRRVLLDTRRGIPAGGSSSRERTLVVVATQTLEVGADLDAQHLVTQSAGVRAITQRFGRLNRLGLFSDATATIIHVVDDAKDIYRAESAEVVDRLRTAGENLDLGPGSIADVLGIPSDTPERLPELLPVHVWEFSKTSVPVPDAAPIEPFFEGFDRPEPSVSVMWRRNTGDLTRPLYPRPQQGEWVEVPIWEVAELLGREGADGARVLSADGAQLEPTSASALRPGQRVILPTIIGGYSDSGWDPSSTIAVRDLSPELSGTVSVSSEALEGWIGRSVTDDERTAIASLAPRDEPLDDESDVAAVLWASLVSDSDDLQPSRAAGLERVGPEGEPWFVWRVEDDLKLQAVDALDELSIAPTAELGDHLRHVGEMARRLAVAIGIDGPVLDAVAAAGAYHDLGKADPRFQRWLGAPEDTLLAKSGSGPASWARARVSSGWPAGARHELLSVQMLDEAVLRGLQLEEADLVRHLVVSHHGHGRPSAARSDEASVKVRASLGTVAGEFTLDPGRPDWQQPERYRHACERFGLWGVALLEALVRQADHIVSAVTEVQ